MSPQPDEQIQNMSQLKVSADFNWKTTRDYEITVKGFLGGLVEVESSNESAVYHRAFIQADQPYLIHLTLPAYETQVSLKYFGQKAVVKLIDGKMSHEFRLQN